MTRVVKAFNEERAGVGVVPNELLCPFVRLRRTGYRVCAATFGDSDAVGLDDAEGIEDRFHSFIYVDAYAEIGGFLRFGGLHDECLPSLHRAVGNHALEPVRLVHLHRLCVSSGLRFPVAVDGNRLVGRDL